MLYYLFGWLHDTLNIPGAGVFQYISFRAAGAIITSLLITIVFGKKLIELLRKKQVGETVRDLGLEGQKAKEGTPTMGGLIILAAILVPTLLFAKLDNIYVIIMLITTVWLGALGFIDDYIKVFKKNKAGLSGKLKIVGQVILGVVVGCMMYFHPDITIKEKQEIATYSQNHNLQRQSDYQQAKTEFMKESARSTKTTIPFVKNNEFDYSWLIKWIGKDYKDYAWIIFIPIVIFFITAISNGANLTDGIDGLATGTSAIIGACLALLAWVSGNIIFANYLNIMYIPDSQELVVFMCAFVGALIGFLWYNAYPAQVFMGDTGSMFLGGMVVAIAYALNCPLILLLTGIIYVIEGASDVLQIGYFKITHGKRIFKMAPLHHHFELCGWSEVKLVTIFTLVSAVFCMLALWGVIGRYHF